MGIHPVRDPWLAARRRVLGFHAVQPAVGKGHIDAWLRGVPMGAEAGKALRRAEVVPLTVAAPERTQVCPTGAVRLEDSNGMRRTIITGTVVRDQPLLTCSECGTPTQTPVHRDFVRLRLPDYMAVLLDQELCPSCVRQRADRPAW